jgi:hypothetical protein
VAGEAGADLPWLLTGYIVRVLALAGASALPYGGWAPGWLRTRNTITARDTRHKKEVGGRRRGMVGGSWDRVDGRAARSCKPRRSARRAAPSFVAGGFALREGEASVSFCIATPPWQLHPSVMQRKII